MANPLKLKETVESFLKYAEKKVYDRNYFDQMKIYMEYLMEDVGEYNLCLKRDCAGVTDAAIYLLKGSKKEYPKLKAIKIERGKFFNSFVDYIHHYCRKTQIEKIPFVMNDLERKLDLVKHYKEYYVTEKLSAEEVASRYYVDEKTIRNDKKEIKEGSLNVFGQKIDIEYDYEKKSFYSTPVPIFTVQNITQIVTILNGLGVMYQNREYQKYALTSAITIWQQLTDTVQKRILKDLVDMLKLNQEWYELISQSSHDYERGFYPEYYMDDDYNLLRYFKNSELVHIYYGVENDVKELQGVRICNYEKDGITVTGGIRIPLEDIIKIVKDN